MKRLLCIVSTLDAGGAETFLMKLHRNINREKYQMDFCVMSDAKGIYEDEILDRGGKIFHTERKSRNPVKCFLDIKRTVKENSYKYVLRVNEHSLSVIDLIAAKAGGAMVLAMRSSNAASPGKLSTVLHRIFSFLPKLIPNIKLAPSTEAAEYTFGKDCVSKGNVQLLHNGLVHDTYKFNLEARNALRGQLGIEDSIAIGHVGRFSAQKNHGFLIDIFKSISEQNENAVLILVGTGGLEKDVRDKVEGLGLSKKVIFAGRRSDVPQLLSAFDVMILPSLYEGMPNVVIEAQAASLPCVISDTITPEADITGLVKYMPLTADTDNWAKEILESAEKCHRTDTGEKFEKAGYELSKVTEKFVDYIFEGASK